MSILSFALTYTAALHPHDFPTFRLAALRSANFFPVLTNHPDGYGVFPDRGLAVYHRYGADDRGAFERVIVVVNFSDFDQFLDIPFSTNATWRDLLNDREANVTDFRLRNERVPSNWGMISSRRD